MLRQLAAGAACVAAFASPRAAEAVALPVDSPNVSSAAQCPLQPGSERDWRAPASLQESLAAAWRGHPARVAEEARLAAADARLAAAGRPLYNPEAEFSYDDEGPDRTTTGGLSLTLDLGGKRAARRDAAAARLGEAAARGRLARAEFARRFAVAWADLGAARQRVVTGERRVASVTRFAGIANRQFQAQDISGLERDLAQLALDEARAEQSTLLAEQADAEARLRALGGDPAGVEAALPTGNLPLPPAAAETARALPELQLAEAAAAAADRDVAVARRNRVADPTIGVRAGRIEMNGVSDNVMGFTVAIPLFVRNGYRAEVQAAAADAAAAQADALRVRSELEAERRRARDSYAAARDAWSRWSGSRATDAERRTNLLERLLQAGELSPSDYLVQLRQTLDTQLAGAELEARTWRAFTDYLAATGQLECWAGLEATP